MVSANREVLVNKSFGMANLEHSVPNKPDTKFRIGSLTKAFTAIAIFQLHEKKKLRITDCIGKYLMNYPNGEKITIYHCLTSTSGIPNYTSFPDFWSTTMRLPSTLENLIDLLKKQPLDFEPGSRFEYSSSGYTLLTAIIEIVSGMPYSDYIREKICIPLGMYNTGCDNGVQVVPNLASGYSFWEQPIHTAYADLSFPLGAYGLYSTTEDLFIWDKALSSSQLLSREHMDKLFTPNLDSYACGWVVANIVNRKCVHHFGDISGFFSDFLRFIDDQVSIIFLSNINVTPVTYLTRQIAKVMFEEPVSLPEPILPIKIKEPKLFSGLYEKENHFNLDISFNQGRLYVTVPKMYGVLYKFKLVPILHNSVKTVLLTEMIHEQITFHHPAGEIQTIEYIDFHGKKHILSRLKQV